MNKCDVIIPIYNAYDCLDECISSVLNYTDMKVDNLILIDDKSPDNRVLPLLEKYAKENKGIILLKNQENLGFVKTVNKGMKYSSNDVLLLNSDTVVTERWLEKIKSCAYSSDYIATVTALSNNATMASVPKIFEKNDIPKGYTIDSMAKVIEEISLNEFPEMPTAHGFCMFIKRKILNKLGYFDEENFGKGYGEENEFSFRCIQAGYKNVLCDNTYILHKESMSFSDEKNKLIESASRYLEKNYTENFYLNQEWCHNKKISYISDNVLLNLESRKKRANILVIIHDWNINQLGGTTMHAYDIILELRKHFNFHVLAPNGDQYILHSYYEEEENQIELNDAKPYMFGGYNFTNSSYKRMIENIIDNYGISFVHIHHLIHHYFDIFDVVRSKEIYTVITLHDFYSVCPLINFITLSDEYCEGKKSCSKCMKSKFANEKTCKVFNENWREKWEYSLSKIDKIIVPSEDTKKRLLKYYSQIKIDVLEHGVDYKKRISKLELVNEEKIDIAFIGAIGIHKGAKILKELVESKKLKNVNIHLFGLTMFGNKLKGNKNYFDHGPYKRENLPKLLKKHNIKLVCLLSTWPETYSYTTTESIASGVPVLVFDLGAAAERVKKYKFGWTIDRKSTSKEVVQKINTIQEKVEEYKEVINNVNNYEILSTQKMNEVYYKIYKEKSKEGMTINVKEIVDKIKSNNKNINHVTYPNYSWVFDTLKWKLISKIKIPKFIKKMKK